jgi:hypothetical protein
VTAGAPRSGVESGIARSGKVGDGMCWNRPRGCGRMLRAGRIADRLCPVSSHYMTSFRL